MAGNVDVTNHVLLVVAATIYLHAGQPEAALKSLHCSEDLECGALRVQALLAMHRPDLAKKELKTLQEKDEDSTVTQLAQVLIQLFTGVHTYILVRQQYSALSPS